MKSGKPTSPTKGRSTTTPATASTTTPTMNQVTAQQQQAIMDSIQAVMGTTTATTVSSTPGTLPMASTGASTTAPDTPAIPVTSSSASALEHPGSDERAQEIGALLQQANAMLNKLTRLQALQVSSDQSLKELTTQMAALGLDEEERMALLDSGASHPFRERALHEDDGVLSWRAAIL